MNTYKNPVYNNSKQMYVGGGVVVSVCYHSLFSPEESIVVLERGVLMGEVLVTITGATQVIRLLLVSFVTFDT